MLVFKIVTIKRSMGVYVKDLWILRLHWLLEAFLNFSIDLEAARVWRMRFCSVCCVLENDSE